MKRTASLKVGLLLCLGGRLAFGFGGLETGGANDITAVTGRTSKDYVRKRLADGSFVPEAYAFGKGGSWNGAKADGSIDKMTFLDVAHIIAVPLAGQKYLPATDPKTAKLLIMVYWGTTHAPEHASESNAYVNMQAAETELNGVYTVTGAKKPVYNISQTTRVANGPGQELVEQAEDRLMTAMSAVAAENAMRDQEDFLNVKMLGYESWWASSAGDRSGTAVEFERKDLLTEIEEDRYFVVLMAYDFPPLWKQKKHKLLWETRFSIRQRHHDFDKDLPAMAQYASRYFGQDSNGLVHTAVPFGHVEIGDTRSLGEADDARK
jgi:hypothetical protein